MLAFHGCSRAAILAAASLALTASAQAATIVVTDQSEFDAAIAVATQPAAGARQGFDALSGEVHATLSGVLIDQSRFVRDAVLGQLIQAS